MFGKHYANVSRSFSKKTNTLPNTSLSKTPMIVKTGLVISTISIGISTIHLAYTYKINNRYKYTNDLWCITDIENYKTLNTEFILRNIDKVDWKYISEKHQLDAGFVQTLRNNNAYKRLDFNIISKRDDLTLDFIERNRNNSQLWVGLNYDKFLTKNFAEEYLYEIHWGNVPVKNLDVLNSKFKDCISVV